MKKILFICPYFGILPKQHMEIWLQSCCMNPSIDWLIITDDKTNYNYPENVRIVYYTFSEMKDYIQSKFKFKINLDRPYKLCDFKPAYGYIFSEYAYGYDFWGHCDISDCIFGNLRKFLNDNLLNTNDKIGFLGHMTLYRNNDEVNKRFMIKTASGVLLENILGVRENKVFDELPEYGINAIYKENNFPFARIDEMYVDISPIRFAFQASEYDSAFQHYYKKKIPMIFEWENGKLYEYTLKNQRIYKRELGYIHLQKRKMHKMFEGIKNKYIIVPNQFIFDNIKINQDILIKYSKDKLYIVFFQQKWKAVKYRIKHIF